MIYYKIELPYRASPDTIRYRAGAQNRKREAQINIWRAQVEYWTVGHGTAFALTLVVVYMLWILARYGNIEIVGGIPHLVWTAGTTVVLLAVAKEASSSLGISGAFAALVGGLFGLLMAAMPGFPATRKTTSKKPPEAERATESEKK